MLRSTRCPACCYPGACLPAPLLSLRRHRKQRHISIAKTRSAYAQAAWRVAAHQTVVRRKQRQNSKRLTAAKWAAGEGRVSPAARIQAAPAFAPHRRINMSFARFALNGGGKRRKEKVKPYQQHIAT